MAGCSHSNVIFRNSDNSGRFLFVRSQFSIFVKENHPVRFNVQGNIVRSNLKLINYPSQNIIPVDIKKGLNYIRYYIPNREGGGSQQEQDFAILASDLYTQCYLRKGLLSHAKWPIQVLLHRDYSP